MTQMIKKSEIAQFFCFATLKKRVKTGSYPIKMKAAASG